MLACLCYPTMSTFASAFRQRAPRHGSNRNFLFWKSFHVYRANFQAPLLSSRSSLLLCHLEPLLVLPAFLPDLPGNSS